MAGELRIWLLGGFRAAVDDEAVPSASWRRAKARALVKMLSLAPDHRLHREAVMEALWPDLDPELAGVNLRKAIHFARQALGPSAIRLAELVELHGEPLWIDIDEFERESAARRLVALYGGELLPEDRYEAWTEEPRERLRMRFLQAQLDLAAEQQAEGDLRAAAATIERLVAADPLHEDAQLALVRLHALAGRRQTALRAYERFAAALEAELGVEPGGDAQRLRHDIEAGRFPSPGSLSPAAGPDERKLVTIVSAEVLVLDEPDPERSRPLIEAGLDAACAALDARGARVERALGDVVIGIFGMPAAHEDDPDRALEAAAEALSRAAAAGAQLRIGVDTGEVLVRAGAAFGEPVRAAARLREQAAVGTMLPGPRTVAAIRGGRVPGSAPLVGRELELASLATQFEEVVERSQPRMVLMSGPAGIGKSRLLQEALAFITSRPGARVLRGRCLAVGDGVTYWALAEVLRDACGISLDDPPAAVEAKLRRGLEGVVAETALEDTVAALAATAGIAVTGGGLEHLEPQAVDEQLAIAWPRYLSGLAATGPCVLAIEDMHWAGDALLQMLERVVARSQGPLLVLGTARPELSESRPGFGRSSDGFLMLSLRPLSDAQSAELLRALTGGRRLSRWARAGLLGRAEGNPYFLEELVQHLAEATSDALPDTIHSLLAARIDALPAVEKRVLQEASVAGRVFWTDLVSQTLGGEDISAALDELERRGLVQRRAAASRPGELVFKHALLREVAYASVLRSRRAAVHAKVGAWFEELARDRTDELAELIAHHYAAAAEEEPDQRPKAFDSLMLAGRAARRRFAVTQAIDLHRRALTFAAGEADRMQALEAMGDDYDAIYRGDEGAAVYQEALEIARGRPDQRAARARLCSKIAGLMAHSPGAFRVRQEADRCEELIAEGFQFAEDERTRAYLSLMRAEAARLWRGSEPYGQGTRPDPIPIDERIAAGDFAVTVGRRLGDPDLVFRAEWALSIVYSIAGRYDDYLHLSRRQLATIDRLQSPLQQGDVLRQAATAELLVAGDFETALALALRGHAVSAGTNPHQMMHATWPVLVALYWLGRWQEMEPFLQEHVANHRRDPADECSFVREGPAIGAVMLAQSGRVDAARKLAEVAGDPATDPTGGFSWQARLAVVLGDPLSGRRISEDKAGDRRAYGPEHALALLDALVALEDWEAVVRFLPTARRAAAGNALLLPWADRAEGLAAGAAGKPARARQLLRKAAARFNAMRATREAAATEALLTTDNGTMAKTDFKSVDEYIATLPEDVQPIMERVRSTIRKAVPGAEESISYQIPTYKLAGGRVLYFAGWKRHYSLYPVTDQLIEEFKDELAPYKISKGTVQFPLSAPVPVKLIERIAKFRVKQAAQHQAAKKPGR